MYSNINLTALEGALKDAINKKIKKVDYDASIDDDIINNDSVGGNDHQSI